MSQALANLDAWIQTWTDAKGGIHGYVVHHHQDCLLILVPDTWTQSPILMAHSALYEKTGEQKWLKKATMEAKYLCAHYLRDLHVYHAATHEYKHKSKPPLIGNALPTLAILDFVSKIDKEQNPIFDLVLDVTTDNIENYFLKQQWDKKNCTFYGHFEPIGRTGRPHIHNMTSLAISALIAYARVTDKFDFVEDYAIPAGEHILSCQNMTGENSYGGYPYNDGRSRNLYFSLYHAITMRGIIDLYEFTHDKEFLNSANIAAKHLMRLIDEETHLFFHRVKREKIIRYPQWLAGSGTIIHQIRRLEPHGCRYDLNRTINSLLEQQHPHGGFPTFLGFSDLFSPKLFPAEPEKRKWRDVLATPNWNCFTFELLSYLIKKGSVIPEPTSKFPLVLRCDEGKNSSAYTIYERKEIVRFIHPKTNDIALQLRKTDNLSQFGRIVETRSFVRQEHRERFLRKIIKCIILAWGLSFLIETLIITLL